MLTNGFGLLDRFGFGLPDGNVVFTIFDEKFTEEDYYLQLYMTKKQLLSTGEMLTSSALQQKLDGTNTVEMLLKDRVESSLKVFAATNAIAKENNIKLTAADDAAVQKQKDSFANELGGEKGLKDFLRNNRTSEKALDKHFRTNAMMARLGIELYGEDKAFDLTGEERGRAQTEYYEKHAKFHYILFMMVDSNNEPLSGVRAQQQRALAEEAYEKALVEGADFTKLIDEYSDDASTQKGKYESYSLKGVTTEEYDEAVFGTAVGTVSAVKELKNGLVIIKRLPLDDGKLKEYYAASRQAKLQSEIAAKAKGYNVEIGKAYGSIVIR